MPIIPTTYEDQINYALNQTNVWNSAGPENIGLSTQDVTDMFTLAQIAQNARLDADAAQEASKTATSVQVNAINTMVKRIATNLKKIKAYAAEQSDPNTVYDLAGIPAPKPPAELKTPPAPATLTAVINPLGGVELKWKIPAKNSWRGATYFIVQRAMTEVGQGVSEWDTIAQPADREFTDATVPPGFGQAHYRVFATRNNKTSSPTSVTVNFGVIGQTPATSGNPTASETSSTEYREAA